MELENKYQETINYIASEIRSSQINVIRKVNKGMIELYWKIGEHISTTKLIEGYGKGGVKKC